MRQHFAATDRPVRVARFGTPLGFFRRWEAVLASSSPAAFAAAGDLAEALYDARAARAVGRLDGCLASASPGAFPAAGERVARGLVMLASFPNSGA